MNRHPARSITDDEIKAYEEDGVVCLRGMFDSEWSERMYAASVAFMESGEGRVREVFDEDSDGSTNGRFYGNVFMCGSDENFRAFRDESPAPEIAATLMGVDKIRFWYDQLFIKEPKTKAITFWHNDLPFWPFQGEHLISIWAAFTPATKETSGVEYIAGSHKWNKFYQARTPDDDPAFIDPSLEPCPNFSEQYDNPDLRFLSWDMEPGDCLCHHPMVVHGAGGNKSATQRRVGLSVRYLGEDVRWDPRPHTVQLPVEPVCAPGEYPADDALFPVIWQREQAA